MNLEEMSKGTLIEALGIQFVELTADKVIATMPVNDNTRQPFGILHGGASVALAETVASVGAFNLVDQTKQVCVGLEINANHIRSKKDGIVKAVGTVIHKGRSTMVWNINIVDEEDQLICVSRCTMAIINKKAE